MQASTDSKDGARSVEVANKRACLMKRDPQRGSDLFGKQLPLRLLAEALSYVHDDELARSQAVCSGWRLAAAVLVRAWRAQYAGHWESSSGELAEVAVGGAETSWLVRYRRRRRTDVNYRRGM